MSEIKEPIAEGNFYHIYNRGNNGIVIFPDNNAKRYFLSLYDKYIFPIADTYAWCLMKNHFHFLIYIKTKDEIDSSQLRYSTVEKPKVLDASKQFSHFFNAFTQGINKKFGRTGSLLEKPFERKKIGSEQYLRKLISYIHNNPIHHGITTDVSQYKWTSYKTIISQKPTKLKRKEVIKYYGDIENFVYFHSQKQNLNEITDLIIE